MPKPAPLTAELRNIIALEIELDYGRNEIARRHNVSTGVVSKIARERHLSFKNRWMVETAAKARQIDMYAQRAAKHEELLNAYFNLPTTFDDDGQPARRERHLSYAIYNINRHHNGTYTT